MKHDFSQIQRAETLSKLAEQPFDLIVIGGGVTGAGICLDASSRGLRVLLVEKNDFSWGTSSRSTKLIHGGLRYLKQLELKLVSEVGRERAIVHSNAPHLVVPERMLLPITKKGSLGKRTASLALWVYDILASVKQSERRRMLTREETSRAEPLVKTKNLTGGALYYEYRTDDSRLTIELVKTSLKHGAKAINHAEVLNFLHDDDGQVNGAVIKDHLSGKEHRAMAPCVVNATGPWVDLLRKKDNSLKGKRLQLTKGVHVVVPHKKLPIKQALYFDVPDGRMIFAIPREEKTYLGTTDTVYSNHVDKPMATMDDVRYILKGANKMFKGINLAPEDVESTWAGLRPLIHQDGKSPSELSRKDEIFYSKSGLLSIAGGKLTGYRQMARRVTDAVIQSLPPEQRKGLKPCSTAKLPLGENPFNNREEIATFMLELGQDVEPLGVKTPYINYLIHRFGKQAKTILALVKSELKTAGMSTEEACVLAELTFCYNRELVLTISDFLIRRTGLLYFNRPLAMAYVNQVEERLKKLSGRGDVGRKQFDEASFETLSFLEENL